LPHRRSKSELGSSRRKKEFKEDRINKKHIKLGRNKYGEVVNLQSRTSQSGEKLKKRFRSENKVKRNRNKSERTKKMMGLIRDHGIDFGAGSKTVDFGGSRKGGRK
jgi:hypothetical protein